MARRRGWIDGCLCRRRLGFVGNKHINFKKKKSALCYWLRLSCRIFCCVCQFDHFFYFSKKYSLRRYCRINFWRNNRCAHCSKTSWQNSFENNVHFCRFGCNSYKHSHALEINSTFNCRALIPVAGCKFPVTSTNNLYIF